MNKQPNHLASLIEKQISAGQILPKAINERLKICEQVTQEFKQLMIDCLPPSILETCQVIKVSSQQLTIVVSSNTAANHILYMKNAYIQLLRQQSIQFQNIEKINVIVNPTPTNNQEQMSPAGNAQAPKKSMLSEKTRQTIAQTAELVTSDPELQQALKRLAQIP